MMSSMDDFTLSVSDLTYFGLRSRDSMYPFASSSFMASRSEILLIPNCLVISWFEGSLSPILSLPCISAR